MDKITKSYLVLLSIFGFVLIIGSVKGIAYPDESIYVPGKSVVFYNSETKDLWKTTSHSSALKFEVDSPQIKTSLFLEEPPETVIYNPTCN